MSTPLSVQTSKEITSSPPKDESDVQPNSFHESIFERSVSANSLPSLSPKRGSFRSCQARPGRSFSVASNTSLGSIGSLSAYCSTEDFVAPVLDTTTEILFDPSIDLNSVTIVCRECGGDATNCRSRLSSSSSPSAKGYNMFRKNSHSGHRKHDKADEPDLSPSLEGQTINFYSFADVLKGEKEGEEFQTFSVGEYLP